MKVLACSIAFNEKQKIVRVLGRVDRAQLLRDMPGVDDVQFMVFDDGSRDGTPEAVRELGFRVESHASQRGVGAAIRSTIRIAQKEGYDVLVILAGNDKDRPSEIPRVVAPILSGAADFVQGSRYLPGGDFGNMPVYRRVATQFVHPLCFSLVSMRRVTDSTNGFRAMRVSLFDDERIAIDQAWLDKYELEPYVFFKAIRLGHKVTEVPVTKIYPPHELGYTKMKPVTGWWSILRPLVLLGLRLKR